MNTDHEINTNTKITPQFGLKVISALTPYRCFDRVAKLHDSVDHKAAI